MKITTPSEPVIYYECSYGDFRLTYHIPPGQLQPLIDRDKISPKVLEDYPDGVDLQCTVHHFSEFQTQYGYRLPLAPDSIHRAFYALVSSTRDWKDFRGTGFVSVKDLKRFIKKVNAYLEQNQNRIEVIPELPEHPTLEQRHHLNTLRARREALIYNLLERMTLEGIDPNQTIKNQRFSPIEMQAGEDAADFFSRLLRTRGTS